MNRMTFHVREELGQRVQALALRQGESAEAYLETLIEEHLEELEDIAIARERLARVASGDARPVPWEEIREEFLGGEAE